MHSQLTSTMISSSEVRSRPKLLAQAPDANQKHTQNPTGKTGKACMPAYCTVCIYSLLNRKEYHNPHLIPAKLLKIINGVMRCHCILCQHSLTAQYTPSYQFLVQTRVLTNFLSFSKCSVKPGSCVAWRNVVLASCTS